MTTLKGCWLLPALFCALAGLLTVVAAAQSPPTSSKGQKAKDLCAIDLSAEIDTGTGRRLRMRTVALEPGGNVAVHGHQDRPTVFVVIKGTLLSHVAGQSDRILQAGDCLAEGKAVTTHWMENKGAEPAQYIAVDVTK